MSTSDPRRRGGLTPAEELRLARRARAGDRAAKNALVEANLRLAGVVARRYVGRGLAFGDLVQEGAIGLIRAAERFDPAHGTRFSTYATWWVRQSISRALADTARTIRLPVAVTEKLRRIRQAEVTLATELGRQPTVEEISALAGVTAREAERLSAVPEAAASLDCPLGESGMTGVDLLCDGAALAAFDAVEAGWDATLARLVTNLSSTEHRVLELRLGLSGEEPQPRRVVAAELGLTPALVRRIEIDALGTLRRGLTSHGSMGRARTAGVPAV